MIIYQDKKAVFLDDIANNYFAARLEDAFIKKTGSLPADSRGWAKSPSSTTAPPSAAAASTSCWPAATAAATTP